jgi:probable rRNA maturation factor
VSVFLANEQEFPVDEARLIALARHALEVEGVGGDIELSVLFVTSDHMQRLNARFAGQDTPTDVLAFPMMEDGDEDDEESTLLGDVVICPQVAEGHARRLGHGLDRELDTLLVHGTLHLLGYDHQGHADGARMNKRVDEVLNSFGSART